MKKNLIKGISLSFSCFVLLSMLFGCENPSYEDNEPVDVTVSICTEQMARTIYPKIESVDYSYIKITGTKENSTSVQKIGEWNSYKELTEDTIKLLPGKWQLSIVCLTDTACYKGSLEQEISKTDNSLMFVILPSEFYYTGEGNLKIKYLIPESVLAKTATLSFINNTTDKEILTKNLPISDFAVQVNESIASGSYKVILRIYSDIAKTQLICSYPEVVHIVNGVDTLASKEISIPSNAFTKVYKINLDTGKDVNGNDVEAIYADDYSKPETFLQTSDDIELPLKGEIRCPGYRFLGWYSDDDLTVTEEDDEHRIYKITNGSSGDKTFYAKWKVDNPPAPIILKSDVLNCRKDAQSNRVYFDYTIGLTFPENIENDFEKVSFVYESEDKSVFKNEDFTWNEFNSMLVDNNYTKVFEDVPGGHSYNFSVSIEDGASNITTKACEKLINNWLFDDGSMVVNGYSFTKTTGMVTVVGEEGETAAVKNRYIGVENRIQDFYEIIFDEKGEPKGRENKDTTLSDWKNNNGKVDDDEDDTIKFYNSYSTTIGLSKFNPNVIKQKNLSNIFDGVLTSNPEIQKYSMSKFEVSALLYREVMGEKNKYIAPEDYYKPVVCSWYEAIAFCNKLSLLFGFEPCYTVNNVDFETLTADQIPAENNSDWNNATADTTKNGYRLPSEVEWEWAARKNEDSIPFSIDSYSSPKIYKISKIFYFTMGQVLSGQKGSKFASCSYDRSHEANGESLKNSFNISGALINVEDMTENAIGIYNMSGNVREWCFDSISSQNGLVYDNQRGTIFTGSKEDFSGQDYTPSQTIFDLYSTFPSDTSDWKINRGGSAFDEVTVSCVSARTCDKAYTKGNKYSLGFNSVVPDNLKRENVGIRLVRSVVMPSGE